MTHFLKGIFFFLSFLIVSLQANSMDCSFDGDLTLFRGLRTMREKNVSQYLSVDDSVGVVGLGTKLDMQPVSLNLKGRLVAAYSPGLSVDPADPAFLDISPPSRFLKWDGQMSNDANSQSWSDIEKAYFLYQDGNFEFSVGRRAVGIGTLKYLPIWNRFVPSVAHVGGPALINNPDDIQMSYQLKKFAVSAIHVQGATAEDNISVFVNTWYLNWIELHALAGYWWQRGTAGAALVKDFGGLTLRGESLVFQNQNGTNGWQNQEGLGLEYAFNARWSIVTEGMFSSVGARDTSEYLALPRDKFEILNANKYLFLLLEYLPFNFWKVSAGSLINGLDGSWLGMLDVKYSWSDNIDLSLQLKQPVGSNGQEFGSDFYSFSDDAYFGYSQQVSLQLNYYF